MKTLVKALYGRLLVLALLLAVASTQSAGQENAIDVPPLPAGIGDEPGHSAEYVVDLLDEAERLITRAAIPLAVGDTYIDRDNTVYEVVAVEQGRVRVESRGKAEMPDVSGESPKAGLGAFLVNLFRRGTLQADQGQNEGIIGIYHTHSAESYEPTSGQAFEEERGDVYEVGMALKEALEAEGYRVVLSERQHLPHDAGAYQRSRRTAAELSRENPVTLIDVHRDAVPDPDHYRVNVGGEQMTGVRIVVGKQNQNRDANLEYAKRIKAIADEKFPGLIIGIFHAKGNYNQDLGPRMILLEFGTHTTTLEEAKRSTALMAQVIPAAAGMAPGTKKAADRQIGGAASGTVWWILGILTVGGAVWYWINREGIGLGRRVGGDDGEQG